MEEVLDSEDLGYRERFLLETANLLSTPHLAAQPDDAVDHIDVDVALGSARASEDLRLDLPRESDIVHPGLGRWPPRSCRLSDSGSLTGDTQPEPAAHPSGAPNEPAAALKDLVHDHVRRPPGID
jgi:hypothetical protein